MLDAPGEAVSLPPWRVERILFDEDGILVVDKPRGLPVHGGDEALEHSVVQRLSSHLEAQGREPYLGVHQRLDQETSGLLYFLTNKELNPVFAAAMEAHHIARTYVAVVERPAEDAMTPWTEEGTIDVLLSHDRGLSKVAADVGGSVEKRKKSKRGGGQKDRARRAITHFKILRKSGRRALLELTLETGRTHQIRASLAHLNMPIVGDRLYGGAPAMRLMLHAHRLSGGPLPREFTAPLPPSLDEALAESTPEDRSAPLRSTELPGEERLRDLLFDAATFRQPLTARTSAYRLLNGAGDEVPGVTVDAYGKFASLNIYDERFVERAREIGACLLEIGFSGIYLKKRVRSDLRTEDAEALAPDSVLAGASAPETFLVDELGMQIHIEMEDGLSTGLFLDMRENRMKSRGWAAASRTGGAASMLNLFCYTSSFSVSAALSGAKTTNVDLSAKALARGRQNFEANGLEPDSHRFFKEDAMKFLERSVRREDRYDFIVLDPPSFATVGKGTFSVKSKYGQAVADCLRLLAPGGRLLAVTNHTKTTPSALRRTIEAAADATGRKLRYLKNLPSGMDCPDHANGPWPSKAALLEVE